MMFDVLAQQRAAVSNVTVINMREATDSLAQSGIASLCCQILACIHRTPTARKEGYHMLIRACTRTHLRW